MRRCPSRTTARSTSAPPTARPPRPPVRPSTRSPTRRCPRSASATSAPSSRRRTSVRSSRCCPARTACCTSASCVAWPAASASTPSRTSSRWARRSRSRSPRSTTAASCRWSRSWRTTARRTPTPTTRCRLGRGLIPTSRKVANGTDPVDLDRVRSRTSPLRRASGAETLLVETDHTGSVVSTVRRTVLPGGLRVVTESMPGVRSASIGVWVGVGSRDETPAPGRCLALPRAPALQGHPGAVGARHLGVAGRRGR